MIARSPIAKAVSLFVAASVVAGAVQWGVPRTTIEIEGSGTATEAKMGSRFEDMAEGTLTAMTPDTTLMPIAQPAPPEPVKQVEPVKTVQHYVPTETVQPEISAMAAPPPTPLASAPVTSEIATDPALPVAAPPPPETIQAQNPESHAPTLSQRPQRRNAELVAKAAQAKEPARRKPTPAKVKRGNADRNNTKGAQTGTRAEAKTSASGKRSAAARQGGNAAVSNYPGQVMRKISRVGKPRVNARGTAMIAFSISSGGGLASISVARSSGSSALDRAAVRIIRQASPFPRPPAGAQRQFSIRINGR